MTSENAGNFNPGDSVGLFKDDGTSIGANEIIDKWTFVRPDGTVETRFRFATKPSLSYVNDVPTITRFRMQNGPYNWTMTTFNHVVNSGTITTELTIPVTSVNPEGDGTGSITVGTPPPATGPGTGNPLYSFPDSHAIIYPRSSTSNLLETFYTYSRLVNIQ
jgi:hypothetical protein